MLLKAGLRGTGLSEWRCRRRGQPGMLPSAPVTRRRRQNLTCVGKGGGDRRRSLIWVMMGHEQADKNMEDGAAGAAAPRIPWRLRGAAVPSTYTHTHTRTCPHLHVHILYPPRRRLFRLPRSLCLSRLRPPPPPPPPPRRPGRAHPLGCAPAKPPAPLPLQVGDASGRCCCQGRSRCRHKAERQNPQPACSPTIRTVHYRFTRRLPPFGTGARAKFSCASPPLPSRQCTCALATSGHGHDYRGCLEGEGERMWTGAP